MEQAEILVEDGSEEAVLLRNRRLTTFALSKDKTSISVVGCFPLEHPPGDHLHARGVIRIQGVTYPVIDREKNKGFEPKIITDESCIIFLSADKSLQEFGRAILVNDVGEILSIAHEERDSN